MKMRITMLLVLIFTSVTSVYAIDPSGSRINENPHSPFEMYIPLVILVIFILGFLILKLGTMLDRGKDDAEPKQENMNGKAERPIPRHTQEVRYRSPIVAHKSVDLYLLKAAEAGSPDAQFELANWYYQESQRNDYARHNSSEAMKWYKSAAAQGHSAAMAKLAELGNTNIRANTIADNDKFKKQIRRK